MKNGDRIVEPVNNKLTLSALSDETEDWINNERIIETKNELGEHVLIKTDSISHVCITDESK